MDVLITKEVERERRTRKATDVRGNNNVTMIVTIGSPCRRLVVLKATTRTGAKYWPVKRAEITVARSVASSSW
jgi:hypothetical protein